MACRFARWTLTVGVLATFGSGCKWLSQSVSHPEHTVGEPTRGPEKWMWQDLSADEYFRAVVPYLELPDRDHFLPLDDEITKRMEFWVSQVMDKKLRAAYPELLANTPVPHAIVIKDPEANAFVSPVPICVNVPVRLREGTTHVGFVELATSGVIETRNERPACVAREPTGAQIGRIVEWFNAHNPQCKLEYAPDAAVGREVLKVSSKCDISPELDGMAIADSLIVVTTANWITINTGLLKLFPDESMILGTITHELGHYYRSHLTTFAGEYDFFYHLEAQNPGRRPTPDATLELTGRQAFQSSRFLQLATINGQAWHSALFAPMEDIVSRLCRLDPARCSAKCRVLYDLTQSEAFTAAIDDFPESEAKDTAAPAYLDFEKKALACVQTINIGPTQPGWISPAQLADVLKRAHLDTLLTNPPTPRSLAEYMQGLNGLMPGVKDLATRLLRRARDNRVGYYTTEQEADEFGIELTTMIGLAPTDEMQAEFYFYKGGGDADDVAPENDIDGLSIGRCETLYKNGWKEGPDHHPVFPSIADYFDDHHSSCFRMFNLDREIVAHKYQRAAVTLPVLPTAQWKVLAERAGELSPDVEPDSGAPSERYVKARVRSHWDGCPYLHDVRRRH